MGRTWKREVQSYDYDPKRDRQEKQRRKKEQKRLDKERRKQEEQNGISGFDFQAYSDSY